MGADNQKAGDDEKDVEADDDEFDIAIYTQDKLYTDISELISSNIISLQHTSKKALRQKLRNKYKLDGKPFKKYAPFKAALARVVAEDDESGDEAPRQKAKKKSKKKKRSRKRKKPSSDEQDTQAADEEPSKKKRKTNSGESIDVSADAGADADGEDADDEEESDDDTQRKKRNKGRKDKDKRKDKKAKAKAKKKKSKKWSKLDKLRQLLRATRIATPKVYSQLKQLNSDAQRTKFALTLLAEKNVPTNDLSIRAIDRIKEEWALKREMEELGLGFGNANAGDDETLQCEDGVPLSTRRAKRKRKEVSYLSPKLNLDADSDQTDEQEQQPEEEEEEEEESEEYQPPDASDQDD